MEHLQLKTAEFTVQSFHKFYKTNIVRDFPASERIPRGKMRRAVLTGMMRIAYFVYDGALAAYLVYHTLPEQNLVRIEYLAVLREFRAKGLGSACVRLFRDGLAGKGLLLEAEDPSFAKNAADRAVREKRLNFYARLGFTAIPDIRLNMLGTRLQILTDSENAISAEEYACMIRAFYRRLLGALLCNFIRVERPQNKK